MKKAIPKDVPGKIEFVGGGLHGKYWKARTAAGLGISRSQLFNWLNGTIKSNRDIEMDLVEMIDREAVAAAARGVELTALKRALVASNKRDRKIAEAA